MPGGWDEARRGHEGRGEERPLQESHSQAEGRNQQAAGRRPTPAAAAAATTTTTASTL